MKISPRHFVVDFDQIVWQELLFFIYRDAQPHLSTRTDYTVSVGVPLVVLNIVHNHKDIGEAKFVEKSWIGKVLRLMNCCFQFIRRVFSKTLNESRLFYPEIVTE